MVKYISSLVVFFFSTFCFGQSNKYQSYHNYILSLEANSVRSFIQDNQGYMWIGTNKGLFSFDGDKSFPHFIPGSKENIMINCGIIYKNDFLLLGTENGLLLYNIKNDKYVPFEINIRKDIRTMILTENDLWLGCVDGLFKYHFKSKRLNEMLKNHIYNKNKGIINALESYGGYIYVGAYNLFGRFSLSSYLYEDLIDSNKSGRIVNALHVDAVRKCIWIGEGHILTKYLPESNTFCSYDGFPVVKSIELDKDNNVLIGSDNGFFVFNENLKIQYLHNSNRIKSIANNIIWSILRDRKGNIWLGSNYGISISNQNKLFEYHPISDFSGVEQGNLFYKIIKDEKGYYWFGGDNGLIRTRNYNIVDNDVIWFNMVDKYNYIPHNHVRDILIDKNKDLWVTTDYGLCRFNYKSERFSSYRITNSDGTHNANWAYDILDDGLNYLWISTYNGGIFKINKNKFSEKVELIADNHFSKSCGLSSDIINQIVLDSKGNIWALNQNNLIDIINTYSNKISKFPVSNYTNGEMPNNILSDKNGNIWIGFKNGLIFVDVSKNEIETIDLDYGEESQVFSLLAANNKIWISSSESVSIVDIADFSVKKINIPGKVFYSMYFDFDEDKILLGGVDGIAVCSNSAINTIESKDNIIITSITVNNSKYINNDNNPSVRYASVIKLPFNLNNLVIKFSNLKYSKEYENNTYLLKFRK